MRRIFLLFALVLISFQAFATAQTPDLLIYQGDTLTLYSNPLEAYYSDSNPRPYSFGISSCWSTGCWRGYQAVWKIEQGRLYLVGMYDCCFISEHIIDQASLQRLRNKGVEEKVLEKLVSLQGTTYSYDSFRQALQQTIGKRRTKALKKTIFAATRLPTKSANLRKLFPDSLFSNEMVAASWYTGSLKVPRGKRLQYVHMGYMSVFKSELVFEIEQGRVVDMTEYDNTQSTSRADFGMLKTISYSIALPLELLPDSKPFQHSLSDTVEYRSADGRMHFKASSRFHKQRLEAAQRTVAVKAVLDSLQSDLESQYLFDAITVEKMRWGTGGWITGRKQGTDHFIRIFVLSNINSQLLLFYEERDTAEMAFEERADYIIHTAQLVEFGF